MHNSNKKKYLWIIGGGEMQVPVISEAKKLGLLTIISDLNPNCSCAKLADLFILADVFDIEMHIEKCKQLTASDINIVGVLAAGIDAPETMARLNQHLGLLGVDPEIAKLVHDKGQFRKRLAQLEIPVPRFATITTKQLDQLEAISDEIGYPLIVKNTDSSGSRGTQIFYTKNLLSLKVATLQAISVSKSKVALIESFWDGPEQTVESLFDIDGVFHPCFITDRLFDKSAGYALETGLNHPTQLSKPIQQEMFQIAEEVARKLGIKVGAAKYDFILTPNGPRIIEMTVRLSGGFDCQYIVPAATGKNVIRAAILTAIGEKFPSTLLVNTLNKVVISRSIWPDPGVITSVSGLDEACKIKGVEKIIMRSAIGDKVDGYTDCTKRTCFIIISANSFDEAESIYSSVKKTLLITTKNN
jgi:biotin carboxylase